MKSKYEEFRSKPKFIIKSYEAKLEENEINKFIYSFNNINIISDEEKID